MTVLAYRLNARDRSDGRVARRWINLCRYVGVDHDHETWLVRGLLCVRCNRIEASLSCAPEILAYLEDPPALRIGMRKYHGQPPLQAF